MLVLKNFNLIPQRRPTWALLKDVTYNRIGSIINYQALFRKGSGTSRPDLRTWVEILKSLKTELGAFCDCFVSYCTLKETLAAKIASKSLIYTLKR